MIGSRSVQAGGFSFYTNNDFRFTRRLSPFDFVFSHFDSKNVFANYRCYAIMRQVITNQNRNQKTNALTVKHISLALACIIFSFQLSAQHLFEWVETQPVGWDLNPAYTKHLVVTDGMNRSVTARFISNVVNYTGLFGNYAIEAREFDGGLDLSYPLTGKVQVQSLAADENGNIYVGGTFMETLYLGIGDSLAHVGPVGDTLDVNAFLLKIDQNGFLVWARNIEPLQPDLDNIADIRIDSDGNPWYAYNDFFNGHLQRFDATTGTDVGFTRYIGGIRGISSFDFDPSNNIFVTGAADIGQVEMPPLTFELTEQYFIFIAKFDAAGVGQWMKFGHDVTFQQPSLVCDDNGNAFVGGFLMDSLTWGGHHLNAPQWVNDFWLTRVDGDGNFAWAIQAPQPATVSGDVARADGRFLDVDDDGDIYMLSTIRGLNDFGNGVVVDAGMPSESNMAVINFNGATGEAQWAINGGTKSFNNTHQIAVDENKNVYFTQTLTDTADFGFFHFDIDGWTNHFVLGKITTLEDTMLNAINDDLSTKSFDIYPNPASTNVSVPKDLQGSSLMITDMTGKQVAFHQAVGNNVNVSTLANGCYTLQFTADRIRFVVKLLKE